LLASVNGVMQIWQAPGESHWMRLVQVPFFVTISLAISMAFMAFGQPA
jgi:hypothetical protein